uniref:BZIP domain-containing protein n=1 Tax=Solanum lycopersicum TaxID=4081 RepID=K4CR05_SOLLC
MKDKFTPPCKAEEGKFAGGDEKGELVDFEMEAAQALACLANPGSRSDEFSVPGPSGRSEALVICKFVYFMMIIELISHMVVFRGGCTSRATGSAEFSNSAPDPVQVLMCFGRWKHLFKALMNREVQTQTLQFHEHVITIQSEHESEPKTSPRHVLNYPPVASRRSRQNMTEEEKEERRLSRVLANRESARQTIRRRQAMYEELTRKAADLSSENNNLKTKKELAAKEYDYLKNENVTLRRQMSRIEKAEAEETDGASRSKPVEISTTSPTPAPNPTPTPAPTSLFNQPPILPFFWPSIVQPFNLLQCSTQNISDIASVVPSPIAGEFNSINRQQISNPGNPLYLLPLPCLIPFYPQSNPFLPWASTVTEKHAETSSANQCSTSYMNMENNQAATTQETETEAFLGFPPDSCASDRRRQLSREMIPTTGPSGYIDTHHQQEDDAPDTNALSCTAGHRGDTSEKTSEEPITCSSEKTADAIAAATEARKRRKELLHLKGHH